jgi:hypothetical protein
MRLVGPTLIRAATDAWTETDGVSVAGLSNPHLKISLEGDGRNIGAQLIRKGGRGFGWSSVVMGPTGRCRRVVDLQTLARVDGFEAAEDDAVLVRVRSLTGQTNCVVELEALDLAPDRIVYEDDDLRVIARAGSSAFVLATFSPLDMPVLQHGFFARSVTLNAELSAVGFVAKRPHWFMSPGMPSAVAAAREAIGPAEVIAYGSSMGAFAALKWADPLGASSVIAMAPMTTIEPAPAGFDPRFRRYFDPERHVGMALRPADCSGSAFVFYDPAEVCDAMHIDRLKRWPNVRAIEVPGNGHRVVEAFAGTERLLALIDAVRSATREGRPLALSKVNAVTRLG